MTEALNKVRAKYPGAYDDLSDLELAEKLVSKYPEYQDILDEVKAGSEIEPEVEPFNTPETVDDSSSFGKDAVNSLGNVGQVYPVLETALNQATSLYGIPASGFAGLGALVFSDLDTAKKVVQKTQELLVYQPQTAEGKQFMQDAFYPLEIYEKGAEFVGGAIEDKGYPNLAAGVHSAISGAPALLGAKGIRGTTAGVSPVAIKKSISKAVKAGLEKSKIIPLKKANSKGQLERYYKDAEAGVTEIIKNRDNLKILDADDRIVNRAPKTLDEFTQAIDQTEYQLFKEYDTLAKGTKTKISTKSAVKELEALLENVTLQDFSPETLIYARQRINALNKRKKYTALEAQENLQFLNSEVRSLKKDGSMEKQGMALVETMIKNNLREELSTAIQKYAPLKEKWGALKTIREDVRKATLRDAKKADKPMMDFSDVYTAGHVVEGMLALQKGRVGGGVTGWALKQWYKHVNSPNTKVKAMFKDVDKYMRKETLPSVKVKDAAGVMSSEQIAQFIQQYDDKLLTDEQIEAFEELRRRGLIHYPKETSDYLRGAVSKEFGIKRRGINKATGKKVIQYEDGRIEDDNE